MKVYVVYYYCGMPAIDKVFANKEKAYRYAEEKTKDFCNQIIFSVAERELQE